MAKKQAKLADTSKLTAATLAILQEAQRQAQEKADIARLAQEAKIAKRTMTYAELQGMIPAQAMTQEGTPWAGLTEEGLDAKLSRLCGMSQAPFRILGYLDGEAKNSDFSSHFGVTWSVWEKLVNSPTAKTAGDIFTFSIGKHKSHYLVIRPDSSLTVIGRQGQDIELTQEITPANVHINSNHGRLYKQARILSGMYALRFRSLEPGDYVHSNSHCWNFERTDSRDWMIYGIDGKLRPADSPLTYLQNPASILDVIR